MTERKSSRKTLTPKRFIPEETEKRIKTHPEDRNLAGARHV
jgi:hypothetical protein